MIGLIVIAIIVPLLLAYLWLARAAVRYAKRKTGSNLVAAFVVVGILVVTFGDTLFNHWYHKEVLCKREDVGAKVFGRVELSADYWDNANNWPKLPLTMSKEKPFLGRYAEVRKFEREGVFALTAYEKSETLVVDLKTGRVLSRFVDYIPAGGLWWAAPLTLIDRGSLVGWLLSRGSPSGCPGLPPYGAVDTKRSVFEKIPSS